MKLLKEVFEVHKELNPKLFGYENQLKEEIRLRLIEIADMFVESIQEDNVPLKVYDYWLVGSNAAYNYSSDSDIDIHIIVDMDQGVNPYLLRLLYDYIKSNFNSKYEIKVKGHEVELYLEDIKTSAVTNGIYSLKQNKWIKVPTKADPQIVEIESSEIYQDTYNKYISLKEDEVEQFIDDLYVMRKISLASEGEFGKGNLVFKQFRNNGYIDELKNRKYAYKSKELTLEKLEEDSRRGQTSLKQTLYTELSKNVKLDPNSSTYAIHHLNGDETDYRKDNIAIMTRSDHSSLHKNLENGNYKEAYEILKQAFVINRLEIDLISRDKAKNYLNILSHKIKVKKAEKDFSKKDEFEAEAAVADATRNMGGN